MSACGLLTHKKMASGGVICGAGQGDKSKGVTHIQSATTHTHMLLALTTIVNYIEHRFGDKAPQSTQVLCCLIP